MSENVTFFTVADKRFFPAAGGLVNSLRVVGHQQPIMLLDCGLTSDQRDVLGSECRLVSPPSSDPINPQLLKPFAHLLNPTGIVVILDSDLIVVRGLDPFLREAASGALCINLDPESTRWFAEWEDVFALGRAPRRQPYVSSGFMAFSVDHWPELLPRWWDACQRIRSRPTRFYGEPDSPTAQSDQDALNAVLMSAESSPRLHLLPDEALPTMDQFRRDVRVLDPRMLSCSIEGRPVTLLHPSVKVKPFETDRWIDQGRSPYPRLLRRLIVGSDVRVRVPGDELPLWLRSGRRGALMYHVLFLVNAAIDPIRLALYRLGVGSALRRARAAFNRSARSQKPRAEDQDGNRHQARTDEDPRVRGTAGEHDAKQDIHNHGNESVRRE